jgi:hypothetical protein
MHKRIFCAVLMAALLLTACAPAAPAQTTAAPTEAATQPTVAVTTPAEVENPVTFFSLSLGENYDTIYSITAFSNEDGTVHVEYVGTEKKVGDLDASCFNGISAAFAATELASLTGQDVYEEGDANGSMYVEFADGTAATVGYSGQIPEAYTQGYAAMDAYFQTLVADLPVFVPQPLVMGDVDPALLETMTRMLNSTGIVNLDAFSISQLPLDDTFGFAAGLSGTDGITSSVSCAPMMMTTAYSLVIVTLEDAANAEAVANDFENTMDWRKWVCVAPSNALLAQKDNMVLCLMASDDLFTQTRQGMEADGWTVTKTLENPDM